MVEDAIAESVAYLGSDQAERDIARDPYWPKWNTPWWQMVLLDELGLVSRIPRRAVRAMVAAIDRHFIRDFPFRLEDVPAGVDTYRNIVCHCALGTMFRLLHDCGVDVDRELGWAREWFLRYQLPDGGLNCDEGAYLRSPARSSFVSTLPVAEAVLLATDRPFDPSERTFLSGVAAYLTSRALVRSLSKNRLIDPDWLRPCFPRFYFYDALRGLRFLANWAERTGSSIPRGAIDDPMRAIGAWFEKLAPGEQPRQPHRAQGTYAPDERDRWRQIPHAPSFALLDAVGPSGAALGRLELEWREVRERLSAPGVVT